MNLLRQAEQIRRFVRLSAYRKGEPLYHQIMRGESAVRDLARALALSLRWSITDEQFDEALTNFTGILTLAYAYGQQATALEYLVSNEMLSLGMEEIRDAVAHQRIPGDYCQRLAQLLDDEPCLRR